MSCHEDRHPPNYREPSGDARDVKSATTFRPFFWRSSCWISLELSFPFDFKRVSMIPLLLNFSWAQLSINSQINYWDSSKKLLVSRAIWCFKAQFRPIGSDFGGNNFGFFHVEKNASKWYINFLCLVTFQKSHFSEWNCQLKLSSFAYRANWNSKSGYETTPELVSMPWIQWWCYIWQTNFRWKSRFSDVSPIVSIYLQFQ